MLRPILELATTNEISRRTATEKMVDHFHLTVAEREVRVPSGAATLMRNRAGWAMTFLTKGRLIEKTAPRLYRATAASKKFLAAHPSSITVKDLATIPGWKESWNPRGETDLLQNSANAADDHVTPIEAIDAAIETLHSEVRSRLLDEILRQSPEFFEQLVLDVLLAMGYGGSREDAAKRLGKSDDEGIDGRINQDPLGLDQIMVQAKRYAPERPIDRKTIQAFIGSLAGQGVSKGVFITTSKFSARAEQFVQRGSQTKVVLIDGEVLLDLMIRHKIGIRVEREILLLDIDQNYFEAD